MENELFQLSAIAVLFVILLREGISFVKWTLNRRSGNNGLIKEVKLLGGNHLEHIYDEMKRQTNQHEKMIEVLTQINTKLDK